MREVRVYDRDFPTAEQMLAGGPGAAFPKEVWLQQMQPTSRPAWPETPPENTQDPQKFAASLAASKRRAPIREKWCTTTGLSAASSTTTPERKLTPSPVRSS